MKNVKVVVIGASGKMGCAIIKGLSQYDDMQIVGAIDVQNIGKDAGELAGISTTELLITNQLEQVLVEKKPDVVIDFTHKEAAQKNIPFVLKKGVAVVAGTTGLVESDLEEFDRLAKQYKTSMFLAPNFSLGAVLMMKFAKEAGLYYTQGEIIEYHNDKKIDSPSGTALATAHQITENSSFSGIKEQGTTPFVCRGGDYDGVRIHSVRLKSLIAHQEVLFAGTGELLTIRHDSFSRESFIPGILIAVRKVHLWQGLKVGLEEVLQLDN